jgi:hypothetical protein
VSTEPGAGHYRLFILEGKIRYEEIFEPQTLLPFIDEALDVISQF